MKTDIWMPFYIADYLKDTTHLTTELHGAYMLLLIGCWTRGGYLPNEDGQLAAIAKLPPRTFKASRAVLMSFFRPTEDGSAYTHKRVDSELSKARALSDARRQNALKGGRPKKQEVSEKKPIGLLEGKLGKTSLARPSQLPPPSEVSSEDKSSAGLGIVTDDPNGSAWNLAVALLTECGDMSILSARSFFGKLLSVNGIEARDLLGSLAQAVNTQTRDPKSYLTKAAQAVGRRKGESSAPKRVGFV